MNRCWIMDYFCVFKTQRFVFSKRCVMTLRWQRSAMTQRFEGVLGFQMVVNECKRLISLKYTENQGMLCENDINNCSFLAQAVSLKIC